MVITKILGGLGNQMFQYAAGRAVAWRNQAPLKLDISGFGERDGYTLWSYGLNVFSLEENFATPKEISVFPPARNMIWSNFTKKILGHAQLATSRRITEKKIGFHPDILEARSPCYLEGYWQSEKYFLDIAPIIRNDFTFRNNPDARNKKMLDQIVSSNAISLHIRRGDYVSNPKVRKLHGICSLNYYQRAIEYIQKRIDHPTFFVFSDDIAWAKKNIASKFPMNFMDYNQTKQDFEDLRLMRFCRHHIIANSTFSWWGAWLADNREKLVIAPREWFCDTRMISVDLLPSSWISL